MTRRTVGRPARVTRQAKVSRGKKFKSGFFDDVESLSGPDARVKKEIIERRKEEQKTKKESGNRA